MLEQRPFGTVVGLRSWCAAYTFSFHKMSFATPQGPIRIPDAPARSKSCSSMCKPDVHSLMGSPQASVAPCGCRRDTRLCTALCAPKPLISRRSACCPQTTLA